MDPRPQMMGEFERLSPQRVVGDGGLGRDDELIERGPRLSEGVVARVVVGNSLGEHHHVVRRIGERPRSVGLTESGEMLPGAVATLGRVERFSEPLETVDEDGFDQTVLAPEPGVDAGGRTPGCRRDRADGERSSAFAPQDRDRGGKYRRPRICGVGHIVGLNT